VTPLLILFVIVYVLVCIFLILVVLLQQGKGADLAGAFGGGGSQTSFGPRAGTNLMHRMTTVSFVLFVVLSMSLAVMSGKRHGRSAMDAVDTTPPPVETTAPVEGAESPQMTAPADEAGGEESTGAAGPVTGADPAAADGTAEAAPAEAEPVPAEGEGDSG